MSLRLGFHEVADEVFGSPAANHLEYGIPVGTFIPDSELAPSRATGKVILRHRRLVFFTFDELGKPKWELRELNYLGEPMSKVCPGVTFTARNCRGNRNTDLFSPFRDLEMEDFERAAFKALVSKHQMHEEWNWPTYDIMRAEPYRRSQRQVQQERSEQSNYTVPTFRRHGMDDNEHRESFLERLEGIINWEMDNKFAITAQWHHDTRKYARERFMLTTRTVDLLQKLLHDTQLACADDLKDISYVPPVDYEPNRQVPAFGLVHPFDVPDDPLWPPAASSQQVAAAPSPGSAMSPYAVPPVPYSTPVHVNDPQRMSTPTPTGRRVSAMDCAPDKSLPPTTQAGEAPPQPTTPTHNQPMNFSVGAQGGEVPWYPPPSISAQMHAGQQYPQLSHGAEGAAQPWEAGQPSPGYSETSTIISPQAQRSEGATNPHMATNNHLPGNCFHVQRVIIPIDANEHLCIDVSREFVLNPLPPGPSMY